MQKMVRRTGKEHAEACLSTLNDWGLQNRVRHPCKQYWFEERCVHFHCKNWLAAITPWNFHFLLFSAPYLGPLEGLILPCSGGSSKPGQVRTIQHMKCLLMTCLTVTHREQMVQFCKTASEGLHQRDDYKEFLQMSLIFFGSENEARVSFRPPGAFSPSCTVDGESHL